MTKDGNNPNGQDEPVPPAGATGQPAEGRAGETPAGDDPMGALQAERDQLEQRLLRVAADFQNYVRRVQQNINDARDQQAYDMAKSLITVLDHFDLAVAIDPARTSTEAVLKGVEMVHQELLSVLEKFGIARVEAKRGEMFDPNHHQALMRQPSEGVEPGHVASMLQPGYRMGGKTLRPAQVSVAP